MSATLVAVRILLDLLYCGHWLKAGTECDMDKFRAETLSGTKPEPHVKILGPPTGETIEPPPPRKRPTTAPAEDSPPTDDDAGSTPGELDGWPGDNALRSAGIETVDQLRGLIAEHGDGWPKQVKGIGKATAADIGLKLAELDGDRSELE